MMASISTLLPSIWQPPNMYGIYLSLLVLVGIPELSSAQPSGYLGKRALISLSTDISPAIRISSRRNISPPLLMNVRAGVDAEYVLTRRFSAGTFLHPIWLNVQYENGRTQGLASLRGISGGVSLRMYGFRRTGNIAPLGPYKKLDLMFTSYWLIDRDRAYFEDHRRFLGNYSDLGIGLTFGTQRILYKNLTYHYGIRLSTVLGTFDWGLDKDERYFKGIATDRLQGMLFINLHIGIGLLVF